jgi:CNT family concentrative nucleoside transporter
LEWLASLFGIEGATIQTILGKLFQPVAFLIGVPLHESEFVGGLLGQKLVFNEFVAFMQFTELQTSLSRESQIIATFALCGFANFASIGVLLGGLGVLAPSRRAEISQLSLRALVAATLANLMSAAIAGTFMGWS